MNNTDCGRCSVSQITQFRRCIFSKNSNIFRHLKLGNCVSSSSFKCRKKNRYNSMGQFLFNYYNTIAIHNFTQVQLRMFALRSCAAHFASAT